MARAHPKCQPISIMFHLRRFAGGLPSDWLNFHEGTKSLISVTFCVLTLPVLSVLTLHYVVLYSRERSFPRQLYLYLPTPSSTRAGATTIGPPPTTFRSYLTDDHRTCVRCSLKTKLSPAILVPLYLCILRSRYRTPDILSVTQWTW